MEANRIELDRSNDGIVVVVVEGEHDVHTAPSLRDKVESVIGEKCPLVIDLSPATFIDSSILRVLLEARRLAQDEGLGFAVVLEKADSPGVRRILEVTGLMPVLPVLPEKSEALERAKSSEVSS